LQVTIHSRQSGYARGMEAARGRRDPSPLSEALDRVGDRWTLLLVEALLDGPRRFGDLQEAVPGIAPNVLTGRLRHLEREALVVARPYSRRPPRFTYELTESGAELAGALRLLADWGARQSEHVDSLRHERCGTPLEARWWCPACELVVDEDDATDAELV
jgi:DNA-binding HxlR family transcriptional regulator